MTLVMSSEAWHSYVTEFLRSNPEFSKYGRPCTPTIKYPDPMKSFSYFITYQALKASVCKQMWIELIELVENLHLSLGVKDFSVWQPKVMINIPFEHLYGRAGVGLAKVR